MIIVILHFWEKMCFFLKTKTVLSLKTTGLLQKQE